MASDHNRYPGRCAGCSRHVAAGAGYARKSAGGGRWAVYCSEHVPERRVETRRELTAAGVVHMPYEPERLPLLRAMPGARWDAEAKVWRVSIEQADRPRVLEIADQLGLAVADELREVVETAAATAAREDGLYPFQVAGVDHLARRERALLADEMGLGKTVQALRALPERAAALAICPASLKHTWAAECRRWRPDLAPVVISGRGSFRAPAAGELVIVNYDILPAPADLDGVDLGAVRLIVDEAHKVKGRSQRSAKVRALAGRCATTWALTGTPLLGRPFDLWGVLSNAGMARDVMGWQAFLRLFGGYKNRWGGWEFASEPQPEAAERLRRVMLRRLRADVLPDLPGKTYSTVTVNGLTASSRRSLDAMLDEWGEVLAAGVLPPFEEFSALRAELAASRIDAMLEHVELAEESDVPLLVFSAHRSPIDALEAREGWATITGDTPAARRQEIVDRFQAGALRGVGMTIQAGGVGLTLTRAWRGLFVDLDWTPANNAQAEDRMVRIGQRAAAVEIIRMVSDHPLDQRVLEILDAKQRLIEAAVEGRVVATAPATPADPGESEEEYQARMARIQDAAVAVERDDLDRRRSEYHGIMLGRAGLGSRGGLDLDAETVAATRAAFAAMLGRCDGAETKDGAGFNKPDAAIAWGVLRPELESIREVETAYAMLRHYPRQLAAAFPLLFPKQTGEER